MLWAEAGGSEVGGTTAQVPSLLPHLLPTHQFPLCELEGEGHELSETPASPWSVLLSGFPEPGSS